MALTCKKCGDTGICKSFDEEGATTTCKDGVMTCVHSFLTDKNGTRMILKDCLDMQKYIRMVGCVRVKNTGMDDHSCFCDTDDCNKDYCDAEHCDCAYADPDKCFDPVDPSRKLNLPSIKFVLKFISNEKCDLSIYCIVFNIYKMLCGFKENV